MHDDDDVNRPDSDGATERAPADPLAADLVSAAELVDVGEASEMLLTVRSTSHRRRRRRNALVGIAAAGTLVASGVVVAALADGGSGDDLIVSAPDTVPPISEPSDSIPTSTDASTADETVTTEPAPTTVASPATGAASTESVESVESSMVDPVPVRLIPSTVEEVNDSVAAESFGENQLFAWKDGFLSIQTSSGPQPLPTELPQEVIDAFPPEVVDFFPDGLPATIDEAMRELQEAGLLDEVTDIVVNNPDVSDAIYSQQVAPQRTVRFSVDGVEWADLEATFPAGVDDGLHNAASTGERFAFTTMTYDDQQPVDVTDPAAQPIAETLEVHSTTDLITWTTQSIPLTAPPATDSLVRVQMYPGSFAATDAGYVVSVQRSVDFDVFSLLDPALQERANSSGYGTSYGDRGVTISFDEVMTEDGADADSGPEIYTFTWDELGVDSSPADLESNSSDRWAGTWDGRPPVMADAAVDSDWVVAVGDDFVELGPTPRRSRDGVTWEPIELPGVGYTDMIVETPDGVALRISDRSGGATVYTGDLATGDWTPLETPGLPSSVQSEGQGRGGFLLARYGDEQFVGPYVDSIGSRSIAEVDGYLYELEMTGDGTDITSTYTVTDVESGAVVATETAVGIIDGSPFEHVDENSDFGGAFTVLDPDSGDPIVTIPYDSMRQQIINADGSVTAMEEFGLDENADWSAPEYWVLAALDDGWMLQQISDGSSEERYPNGMVAVGDVVMIAWPDGSFTRVVPA